MNVKNFVRNFALLSLGIILCLGFFELYLRAFGRIGDLAYRFDPLVGSILLPDRRMKSVGREYEVFVRTKFLRL